MFEMTKKQKIMPCLWFDNETEEAASNGTKVLTRLQNIKKSREII